MKKETEELGTKLMAYCHDLKLHDKVDCENVADFVINTLGYHNKNQWIGVDERLPEIEVANFKGPGGYLYSKSIRVLCACKQKSGKMMVKEGFYEINLSHGSAPYWKIPGTIDSVTHWMYLPKLPKED